MAGDRVAIPGRWLVVLTPAAIVTLADLVLAAVQPARIVAWDARVYWDALVLDDPYSGAQLGVLGSYLYSPAFLALLAPAELLGWHLFLFAFTAAGAASAGWLVEQADPRVRRWWPILAAAAIVELWAGNIHLFLAAAIVIGLRSGAGWTAVVLTKVTPAVGIVWHLVRREWRALAVTVGAVTAVVAVTLPAGPELWPGWIGMLTTQERPMSFVMLPIPLPLRLAAATLVVAWAALADRRWVVPIACLLALPGIWPISLAMALGAAALWRPSRRPALEGRARRAASRGAALASEPAPPG
jgi:hypothetical protein